MARRPHRKTGTAEAVREARSLRSTGAGPTFASSKWAVVVVAAAVLLVYGRIVGAGFVEYDDDLHVYANPLLHPVSLSHLGQLWAHAYQGLYIPLAYTILAGVALTAGAPDQAITSLGQTIAFAPAPFHVASLVLHAGNTLLVFALAARLTRGRAAALLCALVFAMHPLQVESVAWISEWRGLTSACFGLAALNALVSSRQSVELRRARALLAASMLLALCAMLCKPTAMVLPLVALIVDRAALGTSWRRALALAGAWAACVLPLGVVTRSVQPIHLLGRSSWWQRPFIAGDALVFYLRKTVVPTDLAVEYGRTPQAVLSHASGYAVWIVPAALLALVFAYRRRRPVSWLGSLLFVAFLLPTLGLVPFTYQAQSTVACRYAYLPMLGIGLVAGDLLAAQGGRRANAASWGASVIVAVLALSSFWQSGYWADNAAFLRHTLDVNPNVAFAHNNLGSIALKEGRPADAIEHLDRALELDPGDAKTESNLGLALLRLGRFAEAESHYRRAVTLDPRYVKAHENLAALYLQTARPEDAIASLQTALEVQPSEAKALNDLGVAFMQTGREAQGVDAFRRAVAAAPDNAQYRANLERALQNSMRIPSDGSTIR